MTDKIHPLPADGQDALRRRDFLRGLAAAVSTPPCLAIPWPAHAAPPPASTAVTVTGAQALAGAGFSSLARQRIGLVTNQTGRVGARHLVDAMRLNADIRLTAIFAPEHGFGGTVEAGATVAGGRYGKTGIPVYSLFGDAKKPNADMLRDVDVLVFDIQDIGVRFYTYISTMGLAMQAAAARGIPFVVLDRPNPLGGDTVSGFVLDRARRSFIGKYAIPIVHGMTVGELAQMIKGAHLLDGLDRLDLNIVPMTGWRRAMRWPATRLAWVATSPNIPTFESALLYPGIGMVGETLVNEGRGTPTPFSQFGAPWLGAGRIAADLNALRLPGVHFEATSYTPRSIPDVALHPRFENERVGGVGLHVTDVDAYRSLEVGMHVLARLQQESRARGVPLFGKLGMFHASAGTARLHRMVMGGASGFEIISAWAAEVQRFRTQRQPYLIY